MVVAASTAPAGSEAAAGNVVKHEFNLEGVRRAQCQ
jgi:hypothetical protein